MLGGLVCGNYRVSGNRVLGLIEWGGKWGGGNGCSVVGQRLCFYYTCYLCSWFCHCCNVITEQLCNIMQGVAGLLNTLLCHAY